MLFQSKISCQISEAQEFFEKKKTKIILNTLTLQKQLRNVAKSIPFDQAVDEALLEFVWVKIYDSGEFITMPAKNFGGFVVNTYMS